MISLKDPSFESQNLPLQSGEAHMRGQILSDVHYGLTIVMPKDSDQYRGQIKITFSLTEATENLFIDFQGQEISSILINEKAAAEGDVQFLNHRIKVLNLELLQPNAKNTIKLDFLNTFVDNSAGLHKYVDPKDNRTYIYSHCEPFFCHRWFPCFDQPNIRAPLDLNVLSPAEDWVVVANGPTKTIAKLSDLTNYQNLVKDGEEFWHHEFEQCPPISTYIYNMCAGQFDVIENEDKECEIPMRIFLRNSKKDNINAPELFRVMKVGIKFYESYTGIKFPWSKYDQIFCPQFRIGAMENVGAITFTDAYLQPKDAQTDFWLLRLHYVALHELAHMWFGDLVTMDWWNDLWLKESFADFMAATNLLENEELQNYKNSEQLFLDYLRVGLISDKKKSTHPIQVDVNHTEDAVNVFDAICYRKGASFVKQMRHYVGRDVLTDGMNEYFTKYALGITVMPDFIACQQNAAQKHGKSNIDIQAWSNSWLTKSGVNSIQADFTGLDESGKGSIKIAQHAPKIGDPDLHEQVIDIKFYALDSDNKLCEHVMDFTLLASPETVLESTCPFKPQAALLNAGNKGYADILFDSASIQFFLANISKLPVQLNRSYVWITLFTHIETCDVAPMDFLKCFVENIGVEEEQNTLTFLLNGVASVMKLYVEDSKEIASQIFDTLIAKVKTIQIQSLRNLLLNHALTLATTVEQKKFLQECLSSKSLPLADNSVHSLTKTQRYIILRKIFARADIERAQKDELLAQEMQIDYSDVDELQKIGCLACIPDDENKASLWQMYVEKTGLQSQGHYVKSQLYFYNGGNKQQSQIYAAKFFEVIDGVKQKFHRDYGQAFFQNLSPAFLGQPEHLAKFKEIQAHVQETRSEDTHFLKLLSDEIEQIELILKVRGKWNK